MLLYSDCEGTYLLGGEHYTMTRRVGNAMVPRLV
jgi:hypothetical protein